MYTLRLYRFKPGMTAKTLQQLRLRGAERLYPGAKIEGGTYFGRMWAHPRYTHGSIFERKNIAAVRKETEDLDNLLENLRILSPRARGDGGAEYDSAQRSRARRAGGRQMA